MLLQRTGTRVNFGSVLEVLGGCVGKLTVRQYSDETAKTLAEELLRGTDGKKTIAVVSAPSVFVQLKNILVCLKVIAFRFVADCSPG